MRVCDHVLVAFLALGAGGALAQNLPPVVGPGGAPTASPVVGKPTTVEGRLARIERLLDSGTLIEMATRLDQLQNDVQKLAEVGNAAPPVVAAPPVAPAASAPTTPPATPPPAAPAAPPPVAVAPAPPPATVTPVAPVPPAAPTAPAVDPAKQQLAYQAAFDLPGSVRRAT